MFTCSSCHRVVSPSTMERRSLRLKRRLLVTNFSCILAAVYCYWRHNTLCEPGMYSLFSLLEYSVVLTNMAFHFTSYYDFYCVTIQVGMMMMMVMMMVMMMMTIQVGHRLPELRGATRHE